MRAGRVVAGGAALAVVAVAAYAALEVGQTERGPREGSVVAAGPPVEIESEPASYHVVYRVEDYTEEAVSVTADRVWVRRPFESRLETWRGAPPGDEQLAVEVSRFGRLATGSVDQDRLVTGVPPGMPASDVRIAPMLDAAREARVVIEQERREVLGRPCQVYRSSGFFTAASLQPPSEDEYAETCVDSSGIALEEVLVLDGAIRHRRVAVKVTVGAAIDDERFGTGEPNVEVRDGGGSVREADPASRPEGAFWQPPELYLADLGFPDFRGRYGVIPPQADNFSDPLRSDHIVAGVSDVWVGGHEEIDFVVVDQGGTLRGAQPFVLGEDTPRVDLGALGRGEVLFGSRGNEVRVLLGEGRYLRVYGTVTPDRLAEVARRLQAFEGGGLIYLDDPG